jgi:hypothetical protein
MPIFSYAGSTLVKGYPTVYFSPYEIRSLMKSKHGALWSNDGFSFEAKMILSNRRSERSISSTTQRFDDPTISPCRGHQDAQTEYLNLPLSDRTTEHRIEIPIGSAKILPFFPKNRPLNRTDLQYDSCYCAFGWFVRLSPEQVLESNTLIGKYLLYSQYHLIINYFHQCRYSVRYWRESSKK